MKQNLSWCLIALFLFANGSLIAAEEQAEGDQGKMSVEKIIEDCEKQYNEQNYPDADERNRLVDQCIDDNTAADPNQPAAAE